MLSSHRRTLPVSLPRFELGALLLVLGLAAALAAVVGIAAFTLTESTGYTTSQLQAAAKTAYAHGHDAGYAAGQAAAQAAAQTTTKKKTSH